MLPFAERPLLSRIDGFFPSRLIRLLQKTTSVAHPLHVHHDRFRLRIFGEELEVLVELDIGLVAHAHVVGKALLALELCLRDEMQRHVSTLRQQGEVAFGYPFQAHEIEAGVDVDHSAGIRAENAHVVTCRDSDDLVL